jgi:hypothetical protein
VIVKGGHDGGGGGDGGDDQRGGEVVCEACVLNFRGRKSMRYLRYGF